MYATIKTEYDNHRIDIPGELITKPIMINAGEAFFDSRQVPQQTTQFISAGYKHQELPSPLCAIDARNSQFVSVRTTAQIILEDGTTIGSNDIAYVNLPANRNVIVQQTVKEKAIVDSRVRVETF